MALETPQHIAQLLYRHLSGTITVDESAELNDWVNASADRQLFFEELNNSEQLTGDIAMLHPESWEQIDTAILQKVRQGIAEPVHRVHFLKTAWFRYAAAAIFILGIGAYLWNIQKEKPNETTASTEARSAKEDVPPGGNKAVLTLSDGSTIVLDSAATGMIATQQGASVIKRADGQIVYEKGSDQPSAVITRNTMTTPRGGQYQLVLPDGTQVWLNAASSITYPTAFTGSTREVSITGEAYFEVAKDKVKRFIVNVDGKQTVEVLGTHFNINAYKDENAIKTTLIEGAVTVAALSSGAGTAKEDLRETRLKPGEQAILTIVDSRLSTLASPDLDHVLAWKNGTFVLNNTDLPTIMRQIMRWYEVDVVYEGKPTNETFGGVVSRNLPLSEILDLLKNSGVSFRLNGRTLYVRP